MTSNKVTIHRGQRPAHPPHRALAPTVARLAAQAGIDRWLPFGVTSSLAGELGLAEKCLAQDVITMRARRLLEARITFVGHPSFDDPAGAAEILGPMPGPGGCKAPREQEPHGGFPSSAAEFQEHRILTREQEAHLFRKMNFLKSVAARLREAIHPEEAVAADLDRFEGLLREAGVILNRIIRSNQGLVVYLVKKYTAPGQDFFDLVSDGNVSLLRASERFDFARGVRFSTYATWVITHDFVRGIRREKTRHTRFVTGRQDVFQSVVDHRSGELPVATEGERSGEAIRSMLGQLDDRERTIIVRRFGLTDNRRTLVELGRELGISKERVRQIESRALRKLRETAETQRPDPAEW
jgi:RNA polymerase primary sigma factor